MSIFSHHIDQKEIVNTYFSDTTKKIQLKAGEILLNQNEDNHRIFYVQDGKLAGYLPDKHLTEPVFEAPAGAFVGVYSFFSDHHKSYSQLKAIHPSTIYYFDGDPRKLQSPESEKFLSFLFNIVVLELRSRQRFAAKMAHQRQEVMNKLIKTEKLATLGQLAAGLAHELNNTIGSLNSNLGQMETDIKNLFLQKRSAKMNGFFNLGLDKGQQLSSNDARMARKSWPKSMNLNIQTIKKLSKAGITPDEINSKEEALEAATLWTLGYMLHDMKIASSQATHVTKSIRSMGISNQRWSDDVNLNDTIVEALAILRNLTKRVELQLQLVDEPPLIKACHGELVQVWVNLIKNAIESLMHHKVDHPTILVKSVVNEDYISILIEDNGIGIDPTIQEKIYEPNFTTKVEGLSLGLGLGLSIVQRIVDEHGGEIFLESQKGKTCFEIRLKSHE